MRERTLETEENKPDREEDLEEHEPELEGKTDLRMQRWQVHRSIVQLWEETKKTVPQPGRYSVQVSAVYDRIEFDQNVHPRKEQHLL